MIRHRSSIGKQLATALGVPHSAVIAHRGAAHYAPEATRPAYLLAREMGVDYLEIDLQRTKDGALIAFHDDDLRRTTNAAKRFPGREMNTVDAWTFAELQRLDAGSWFNAAHPKRARSSFEGLKILRLDEVMRIAEEGSQGLGLYIETKAAHRFPGIERQLVEALMAWGWISGQNMPAGRTIFQSFEAKSLAILKGLAPQIPRVLLIDEIMMGISGWASLLKTAGDVSSGIGTWGFRHSLSPHWSVKAAPRRYMTTWPWYIRQAHDAGLLVHPWTIDARWEMWMLRLFGCDGLFTNRPDVALETSCRRPRCDLGSLWDRIGY